MDHKRLAMLQAPASKRIVLRLVFGLAALLMFAGHAAAQNITYNLDPAHTIVRFKVRHLMISYVDCGFNKVAGTVQYDPKDLSKTAIQATIDSASEISSSDARDKDVKDNYLEVEKYPTMTFQSKSARAAGAGAIKVTGDLTIHGVTKEVVLDVTEISGPLTRAGVTHYGAVATTKISRNDFGITKTTPLDTGGFIVGDEVAITINIDMSQGGGARGTAPPAAAPAQRPTT